MTSYGATQQTSIAPASENDMNDKSKSSIFLTGPAGSPHFIRTLERDHNEFRRLYADFQACPSLKDRQAILNELIRGLSIHDAICERHLYPTIAAEVTNDGKALSEQYKNRAAEFRKLLITVDKTKIDDPSFNPALATLMQELDMLINIQERELFPTLATALNPTKAEELGRSLDSARTSAPTHPHSAASKSSVLGAITAPFDKLKDAGKDFAGSSKETQDVIGK